MSKQQKVLVACEGTGHTHAYILFVYRGPFGSIEVEVDADAADRACSTAANDESVGMLLAFEQRVDLN